MESVEQLLIEVKAVEMKNGLFQFMLREAIQNYYVKHYIPPFYFFTFQDGGFSLEIATLVLTNNFHKKSIDVWARRDDILDAVDWVRRQNKHVQFDSRHKWGRIRASASPDFAISTLNFLIPSETIPNFAFSSF